MVRNTTHGIPLQLKDPSMNYLSKLEVVTVRKDNINRLVAEYLVEGLMR
jgi:hypothetical protein